ncbi:MAG: hypothetical protein WC552_02475 [Candidatus Omnitrophota bacterium]
MKHFSERIGIVKLNIILLSLISLLIGLELLVVISFIFSFLPLDTSLKDLMISKAAIDYFRPEREVFLYRFFVAATMIVQVLTLMIFRKRLDEEKLWDGLRGFLISESIIVGLIFFALFKMVVYEFHYLTRVLFALSLALSVLTKILWPFRVRLGQKIQRLFYPLSQSRVAVMSGHVLFLMFIAAAIYIPNLKGAVAVVFKTDRFYHTDSFIMAPGWAVTKGLILNVDVLNHYGFVGMPIVLSNITKLFGAFTYENVLLTFMVMTIVYFMLTYLFLKSWLRSSILAAAGVLLALKFQLFWFSPSDFFIWRFPSVTVVRYFFDVLFFMFLWLHIEKRQRRYLLLMAGCVGFSLFYLIDTGVYLFFSLFVYLFITFLMEQTRLYIYKKKQDALGMSGYAFIPVIVAFILHWVFAGKHVFAKLYWQNLLECAVMFVKGSGSLPIYEGLLQKQYWAFFAGIFMGLLYLFTVIFCTALIYLKKMDTKNSIIVVIGVYGLSLYHYWICRSAPMSYLPVCIPAVFIICFWMREWIGDFEAKRGLRIALIFLSVSAFSLLTTPGFIRYPNVFNLTRNNLRQEINDFQEALSIEEDAKMIASLTREEYRVPLISSFEMAFLIKADRAPYFRRISFISSRSLQMKDFGGIIYLLKSHFNELMEKLDEDKPEIIFFEKKLILGEIPAIYYQYYEELTVLTNYVRKNYVPLRQGKYLVALARKK